MNRAWAISAAIVMALAAVACAGDGLRVVEADGGEPVRATEVAVYIDDGIRCVTTPCPTNSRQWQGQTDSGGWFLLPAVGPEETATLLVEGYLPAPIERPRGTIRLERPAEQVPIQRLGLRLRFLDAGETLEVQVNNPGPELMTVVRPRADALERYGDWGGWHFLVKDGLSPFLPEPFPGPFVPPSQEDVVTMAVGQTLTARVRIGDWQRVGEAAARVKGQPLRAIEGRLTARVRWSELPGHLRADNPAPRIVASARTRRVALR